ncbi:Fc.00g064290.m01.CDS01 [Cosmosporella sp. VM-42]
MRRANPRQIGSVCQRCAFLPAQAAKQRFTARAVMSQAQHIRSANVRLAGTRWSSTASVPGMDTGVRPPSTPPANVADPAQLAEVVEKSRDNFLSTDGIPTKQLTTAALQTCLKAAEALQPQVRRAEAQTKAPTSRLVALGSDRTGSKTKMDTRLRDSVNKISYSAYTIISHPNVEMTPEFLELYVVIQATLGRPESLPTVLDMFATKRKPIVKNGEIQYVTQNPNAAVKAIEEDVANMALQTAIEAKNLDAALGIVEASFSLSAYKRQKMLKHSTAPGIALATLPFGIFGLASGYAAYWQNTMDVVTATGIGAAGISGYFFVVGSLGMIAKLSNKDQMKRVTWAPGTPLRYRWLREEERAAMDKIACAWGFKEPWRHGEESGPEWDGLKEYMGYRQMILDRVEFMEGMS